LYVRHFEILIPASASQQVNKRLRASSQVRGFAKPGRAGIVSLPLSSNKDVEERKMAEFTLKIDGMHCGSCVRRVSQALAATPGVVVNEVRVGAARLTAADEPAQVELAIAALAKAGYTAHLES
jgi:copper chaperone CopZ